MSTQDFVSPKRIDEPRHEQNMPEGVDTPIPDAWTPARPGDSLDDSRSESEHLLGNAGPNVGYALSLIAHQRDNIVLAAHEHAHDVEPLLGEIAMRRASHFGRAPMMGDVTFAMKLLSYDVEPTQGEEKWRPRLVHDCGHNEHRRRIIVNSIPEEIVEGSHVDVKAAISGWWEKLEGLF